MKEKLDIAESVVTILMFVMAVWGSIISFEKGFWYKLDHIVNHYHQEFTAMEDKEMKQSFDTRNSFLKTKKYKKS